MDPRRLELLVELSRLGSMGEVAQSLGVSTSTVSQQLGVLAREAGTTLVEPDGRRVRLTPAGRRLADHAVGILAAIDAARVDLDPTSEPAGTVRVAAYETAVRVAVLPVVHRLATDHPEVQLQILEHEPDEALELLADDGVDLALVYDYNLAPRSFPAGMAMVSLACAAWALGVRTGDASDDGTAADVMGGFRDHDWIVNSRNTADEDVICSIASMAGFHPRIRHRADSLDLVQQMILAGLGVGLLPAAEPTIAGVSLVPLEDPSVLLRAYATTRLGRAEWPALALVLRLLTDLAR
jgi:DNA-binding transcriptional LysR family regulator